MAQFVEASVEVQGRHQDVLINVEDIMVVAKAPDVTQITLRNGQQIDVLKSHSHVLLQQLGAHITRT